MNVAVDDEDLRHIAIGDHQTSCDGDIVEDGEAGTLVGARVMTAAGRIAGEALGERQAAGEDRAARRRPRAHCHALVHLEADLPLDPLGHRLAEHLIHITRVMGEPQPAGKGRGGNVPAVLFDESIGEEDIRELRKLRHRKAVRGVETGVEGGMMDDGKPHGATDSARACQRTARPADASGRAGYEGSAALTFRSARIGPCDFSSRFRTGLCRSGTFAPGRREGRMRLASAELT